MKTLTYTKYKNLKDMWQIVRVYYVRANCKKYFQIKKEKEEGNNLQLTSILFTVKIIRLKKNGKIIGCFNDLDLYLLI